MTEELLTSLQNREYFLGPLSSEAGRKHEQETYATESDKGPKDLEHWQFTIDQNKVAWVLFDMKDKESNVLSKDVISELNIILQSLKTSSTNGLVIRSNKTSGFCLGADINEFTSLKSEDQIVEKLSNANSVLNQIESLDIPTVAIIHGHCLGGGLELALRCQYRLAVKGAQIGFPEINLGLIPGLEGSVRLTHCIDPLEAMKMILKGKPVSAEHAKRLGIVDDVLEERHLGNALYQYFNTSHSDAKPSLKDKVLTTDIARRFEARQMHKKAAQKANLEHYPAPGALIDLWEQTGNNPESMAKSETRTFAKLLNGETAQELIRVFFLSEKLKNLGKGAQGSIRHVHVIGPGAMGGDIATWCALKGLRVSVHGRTDKNIAGVVKRARDLCEHKHLSEKDQRAVLDRLIPDFNNDCLASADLVIEAVPEELDIKLKVFSEIEDKVKPGAILASNTSSIPIEELASSLKDPSRFVGLHFFNPVAKMKLLEVVSHDKANQEVLQAARQFAGQIERFPVPVSSAPGFLVNRALTPYLMEAMMLLNEGVAPETIDHAAEQFGMPMGPVELADQVGLDICLEVANMLKKANDSSMANIPDWLNDKVDNGDLGRKTGKGLYSWKDNKPKKDKDFQVDLDITDQLVLPMVNACMAILSENVVADADLIDAAMIFGTGFAPFRGGPMRYAEHRGYHDIFSSMQQLASQHGERFKPHADWQEKTKKVS